MLFTVGGGYLGGIDITYYSDYSRVAGFLGGGMNVTFYCDFSHREATNHQNGG